jgi:hypothetical protein
MRAVAILLPVPPYQLFPLEVSTFKFRAAKFLVALLFLSRLWDWLAAVEVETKFTAS